MYFTKKGTTPLEFRALLDAVFVCRARHNAGLPLPDLPFWGEKAYLVGTGVFAQAEAEYNENTGGEKESSYIGSNDSDAFKLIREQFGDTKWTSMHKSR
jgi:hypothetical protein